MMKSSMIKFPLTLMLCLIFSVLTAQAQTQESEALTDASIVKLVRAGFKEKTVIAIIRSRPSRFDLAPDRLIELKRNGVSENIILNMLARDEGGSLAEDWNDDDPFFSNGNKGSRSQGSGGNSTDIFGNSTGSSNQNRTRGTKDSNQGDSNLTGSATVRIMRPPAEAGGAPSLEKTPTLNNDSIVELVEAGFSEGTIIRRIEQSPAEFDLSPPKLAELRRRRVSDRIIAAMTAAMSDD